MFCAPFSSKHLYLIPIHDGPLLTIGTYLLVCFFSMASAAPPPPPYDDGLSTTGVVATVVVNVQSAATNGTSGATKPKTTIIDGKNDVKSEVPTVAAVRPSLASWISAKRAAQPLMLYMDSLQIASKNGGEFPCCICSGLDSTPHRLGDWNWCATCVDRLTNDCQKCNVGRHWNNWKKTYFYDYDSRVQLDSESYVATHGCVACGWRKLELECVKCGKKRCEQGDVSYGAFTCYTCGHPPPVPTVADYPGYATDCVVCGIGRACSHGEKM